MSSIVHKPDGTGIIVTVRLTLNYGRDDQLIELVEHAPARRRAAYIREAMRSGVSTTNPDLVEDEEDLDLSDMGIDL